MCSSEIRIARAITEACSPWVANIAFFLVLGLSTGAWVQGSLAALLTGIVPQTVIVARVKAGKTGDRHVTQRRQRRTVFLMILGCLVVLMGALALLNTPRALWVAVFAALAFIAAYIGVTSGLGVKISVHTGLWLCVWTFLAVVVSVWWGLGLLVLPAIMRSRWLLREHTVVEIAGGFGVGIAILVGALLAV